MAPPRSQKRKSAAEVYESDDGFVANDSDGPERPNKRAKSSKTATESAHFASASDTQHDADGNQYWEISKTRRVTISEFKGKRMVNIREFYEKDGKDLPGKKGISLPIEQYTALIQLLPQIETALVENGERIPRPNYENDPDDGGALGNENNGAEEADNVKTKRKKSNIEETSDEDEED